MRASFTVLSALCVATADAFAPTQRLPAVQLQPSSRAVVTCAAAPDVASLCLTPELEKTVRAFQMVPDQKLRYQQLLFLAQKLGPMEDALQVEKNKVPGCLSVVYVSAAADGDSINFQGTSDSQLTKGLVALLINGLSGSTNQEIQQVKPEFIQAAGLAQSLTPGRNNGFINMLAMMKRQAAEVSGSGAAPAGVARAGDVKMLSGSALGPMGTQMEEKLQSAFTPVVLQLEDESAQHAGHAGSRGFDGESHFALTVVSDAFTGVRSLKRHQMVYAALKEEMPQIHALSIRALAPEEAGDA